MISRPILFSGPMVRAILEGRKTQTRRVLKIKNGWKETIEDGKLLWEDKYGDWHEAPSPYGQPGDKLWVRETFKRGHDSISGSVMYQADGHIKPGLGDFECESWRPSIHMPREASRITLEIANVRIERIQEISTIDAKAEGIEILPSGRGYYDPRYDHGAVHLGYFESATEAFQTLWESINFERGFGWEKNPWVWVLEFKRV